MRTDTIFFDRNGTIVPPPLAKTYAVRAEVQTFNDQGVLVERDLMRTLDQTKPTLPEEEEELDG